jgi:hypothetical protein
MNVELPNGKIAEFPDDMSKDEIKSIISKKFPKPGLLERAANDVEEHINKPVEKYVVNPIKAGLEAVGGFGQGIANIAPGLVNLGISGANLLPNKKNSITDLITGDKNKDIQHIPMFDFVPHTPAATAGNIASFFAGPGALNSLSKFPAFAKTTQSAMKIPMIAEAIKHASNVLGRHPTASKIAGNAILGGAYNPENQLLGMGLGAAGGAAGDLIGKGIGNLYKNVRSAPSLGEGIKNTFSDATNAISNNGLLNKMYEKINPAAHAKELEHNLSHGSNNITENSKQLATDIRKAHNMREEESAIYYNHALKNAGQEPIYGTGHKDILQSKGPLHAQMEDTLSKIKETRAGELYDRFKANPTFENAHRLQSELGDMKRALQSNLSKTQDDFLQIKKVEDAQNQLKEDINRFLDKYDLTTNNPVGGHYRKGAELYQQHVVPFRSEDKLLDIVKGGQTVVKDLHTVFDTPSNIMTKEGIEKIGHINKIMQDLPESSRNRIIFDAIGGNKLSPKALLNKLDEIKSKGFDSYFSPEVEESINALGKKLRNKKYALGAAKVVGTGGVFGAGHKIGIF